jgi:PAS domain S-box-containing protein
MQSLETFKAFFEASPDAIIAVSNKGIIVMASNKVQTLFGYTTNELVGKEIEIIIPATYTEIHKYLRQDFLLSPIPEDISANQELLAKRKDGSSFYAEISLSTINVKEPIVLASIRDVSEQKELYNQLKVSNEQFKGAFEHSAIGMAIVSTGGKWLLVNKRLCDLVGYTQEELLKTTFQDITHPDDLNIDLDNVGKMLRNEIESYQMEKRYYHKNGSTIWVLLSVSLSKDAHGKPLQFVSQIKDITESKKTEKALKESEQRWQFAVEGSGDGLWDWDAKNNTVFFSKRWKEMLGYADGEVGNTFDDWGKRVYPEDKELSFKLLDKLFTKETPIYINEHRILCKDGSYKWVLARGKVIQWNADEKPARIIGTHTDISWQKEKQEELQESFDIISEQNNRLMNFAHIVSHNLRSHSGNFQLILNLLENAESDDEKEQMINLLKDNAQSLSDTIKHLNDVVQMQINRNINKTTLNLNNYIQKTIDVLAGEINQHNVTILNSVADNVEVNYNPAYMESILLNFISNAIKYRHPDRSAEIKLDTIVENNQLILQIADNGKGINLDRYGHKLFGLYKTFHGNTDAKGVGLFITKNQIEAMGGKIEVESWINLGTTFKIFLS